MAPMKSMGAITAFFSVMMLTGTVGPTFGISTADFNNVVNFSVTLDDLSRMANEGSATLPMNRLVILTGDVESIDVLDPARGGFRAEVNLVNGVWHSVDAISLYRCIVTLTGPEFAAQIPSQSGASSSAATIQPNHQILVVASITGVRAAPDGAKIPVVRALFVRPLS
jgi:hypothetical protein